MTRNTCVSARICGSHICIVAPSEFDSIRVGPPSRPSTDTLSMQPSASIIGMGLNSAVMRGLDPRIHLKKSFFKKMDCRVKPGNDTCLLIQRREQAVDQGL